MALHVPMTLTWFRIVAIPVMVVVFYLPSEWAKPLACLVFTLAAVTDWLDGHLARRWGQTTPLGAFLDPVADKLLVATALVILITDDPRVTLAVVSSVIIGREITVSALREWMAELGKRARVAVIQVAKWKTIMQMVGIGAMLLGHPAGGELPIYDIGLVLLIAAAGLTLWSMYQYMKVAWPDLVGEEAAVSERDRPGTPPDA
jgi:CDP-diacylglycerol--glycerol-3-phosphate 3-phosphatidyltransferase/cardiolipin synthase